MLLYLHNVSVCNLYLLRLPALMYTMYVCMWYHSDGIVTSHTSYITNHRTNHCNVCTIIVLSVIIIRLGRDIRLKGKYLAVKSNALSNPSIYTSVSYYQTFAIFVSFPDFNTSPRIIHLIIIFQFSRRFFNFTDLGTRPPQCACRSILS